MSKANELIRIVSWKGIIHVYQFPIEYITPKERIISRCPEALFQGMKRTRLRQFNTFGTPKQHVLITTPEHYDKDLEHFIKCTGLTTVEDYRKGWDCYEVSLL